MLNFNGKSELQKYAWNNKKLITIKEYVQETGDESNLFVTRVSKNEILS